MSINTNIQQSNQQQKDKQLDKKSKETPSHMHKLLNRLGYIVEKRFISRKKQDQIRADLTMKAFVPPGLEAIQMVRNFSICNETEKYFLLPRFYGLRKFGQPIRIDYQIQPQSRVNVNVTAQILPHQVEAYRQSINAFRRRGGGILCLPCGYGKTVLGIILALKVLKMKTLIIVHKEFLKLQWIERIEMFSNARIGIIQSAKVDVKDKDIVIGMLQSISMKKYPREIFDEFGLVIIDEVHHIGAEVFSRALSKISTKYMLGLSATPNRPDKLDSVFKYYIGDIFHREQRKGVNTIYVKKLKIVSNMVEYNTVTRVTRGIEMIDTTNMHTQIARCNERNRLIVHMLCELYTKQQRKVLVLSARIEQLLQLKTMLEQMNVINEFGKPITFGLYIGKPTEMTRVSYRQMLKDSEKCDVVLATVHYASEALDIPDLDTLLLCSSISSEGMIEQACGRILRKFHERKHPYIIDMIDNCGNFTKHFGKRNKFYVNEGYKVMEHRIILEETVLYNRFDEREIDELNDYLCSEEMEKYSKDAEKLKIRMKRSRRDRMNKSHKSRKIRTPVDDIPSECIL
jgi:superfamily II DNA or RNA helicase